MEIFARYFGCIKAAIAPATTQPVLTLSFERGLDAAGVLGPIAAKVVGEPQLVSGWSGQAMKCGPTIGHLEFDTVGILNHEAGTVEMWVCPLDWYSDDGKFHVFFEVRGRGALYLYKYLTSTNLLMLTCPEVAGPYFSSHIPTDFKPAEWHHIAGTWSAKGVMAYLDGKPASGKPAEGELPIELGAMMQIGDPTWQFERSTASLVDEVRVYDRALTPSHIAVHYAGDFDFIVPLSAENSSLEVRIDPETATADVFVDSGGADIADARLQAIIAIVAENEPLPDDTPAVPFANGRASRTLSLPIQEPGNWQPGYCRMETRCSS